MQSQLLKLAEILLLNNNKKNWWAIIYLTDLTIKHQLIRNQHNRYKIKFVRKAMYPRQLLPMVTHIMMTIQLRLLFYFFWFSLSFLLWLCS